MPILTYTQRRINMAQAHWANCSNCGDDMTELDQHDGNFYDGCDDGYRCIDCGECSGCNGYDDDDDYGRDRRVHSWDYRPSTWRPKGNYPAEALMGLELEVGGNARRVADVVSRYDDDESHLYLKEDGSITGVEIVTHPATLAWSQNFDWDGLLRDLRAAGSEVDDGYGLHVHVSRNAFRQAGYKSTPHQMAWLMFMYRHSFELEKLARRHGSRWASFRTPERGELKRKAGHVPSNDDRYVAVNCNNAKTYELRFFRSTLETHELYAALEFTDASVEYTRGIKATDVLRGESLTWDHFRQWVDAKRYPNLTREIERIREETRRAAARVRTTRPTATSRPGPTALISRDDAILAVGEGGAIEHSDSGARYAVGWNAGAWFMRGITEDGPFAASWWPVDTFRHDGWRIPDGAYVPSHYYPVTV